MTMVAPASTSTWILPSVCAELVTMEILVNTVSKITYPEITQILIVLHYYWCDVQTE